MANVAVAVTNAEYPKMAAIGVLSKCIADFNADFPPNKLSTMPAGKVPFPSLDALLIKFQDPAQADKLTAIQQQLDATKVIMVSRC